MNTERVNVKILFVLFNLFLLNLSVYVLIFYFPAFNSMDIHGKNLYFLHANISELFTYFIYSNRNYYLTGKYVERVKSFCVRFILFLTILFLLAEVFLPEGYPKVFLLGYALLFFILEVVAYYCIHKFEQYWYKKEHAHNRVAILGGGDAGQMLGKMLEDNPSLGYKLVGYIASKKNQPGCETLGELKNLHSLSEKFKLNMLFVVDPKYFKDEKTKKLLSLCNETGLRVQFIVMKNFWDNQGRKGETKELANLFERFNPQEIPLDNLSLYMQKRLFDILFSGAVIVCLLSWLIPLIGILIKLDSKGPVFFLQQRTGINNKTFKCIKFRTMKVNKECDSLQAQVNDDRITPIGNFLRRTNMDELPQFINVFIGNMSVVGPRPHMLKHTVQYSSLIRHYKVRHFIKPGITGWAQVNGLRGLTDELWKMEKRVEYDMEYLEKWNFFWDMKIVFKTVFGSKTFENAG